ncbi:MAG TPA: ABC transporter permease [Myxococcaceae bacterium]|nr:ABC transporter permease [Myxococcaceae bacterium]
MRTPRFIALWDNARLALGTLAANPLRSLLTLLGVVIGVTTVVTMMALVEGLRTKVTQDLSNLGANVFTISKWPAGINLQRMDWKRFQRRPNLGLEDLRAVREGCPSVSTASALTGLGPNKISSAIAETQPNVFVQGTTAEWIDTSGRAISSGRFFSAHEVQEARPVVVVGLDVADKLFPGQEALGREIRIRGRVFQIVGLLEKRGKIFGLFNADNILILPLPNALDIFGRNRSLRLNVAAADPSKLQKAQDEVTALLRMRRNVKPDAQNNFEVDTNETMTRTFNNLSNVITAASFGICLLSLVVGGIGILNIMLVSVTERTREIGIRKALGAKRRRILGQFALEAVTLSLFGGVLGLALGLSLTALGRWAFGFPMTVPAWAIALALVMSSGVGLVFGIYPAARAAALDPVEAMRSE